MVRIDVHDPFPNLGYIGSLPSTSNKPSGGGLVTSLMYYSTVYGPVGLVDPGNVFEVRAYAGRFGWPVASAFTLARGAGLPILYGVIADPHHVRTGGIDDSHLGVADDRRRHAGTPFAHGAHFGSAGAWSWHNRSV